MSIAINPLQSLSKASKMVNLDITNGVDDAADDLTQENGVQNKMQNNE